MVSPRLDSAPRFLLYSHDSFGLGHLRRTLTLCEGLRERFPEAELLCVTGSPCSSLFPLPKGVDLVKLPSVTKDERGHYIPRTLGSSFRRLLKLREGLLLEAYRAFRPHLVIVDSKVIGLEGEALSLLEATRTDGVRTVLGIRDIIDEPAVVGGEWSDDKSRWALSEGYDRVCVYGTPGVFDVRSEYPIPAELAPRVEYTGYVVRERNIAHHQSVPSMLPQVLVTMGGGEDGEQRIGNYLACLELSRAPWRTVLIGGPLLDDSSARRLRRRARMIGNVDVRRFYADLTRLLSECSAVVSMGGYNTCGEVLQSQKPWVILPRTQPRMEQALRAERMSALGLASYLIDPRPGELRRAVANALDRGSMPAGRIPSLDGVARVCTIVAEMLEVSPLLPRPADEVPTQKTVS